VKASPAMVVLQVLGGFNRSIPPRHLRNQVHRQMSVPLPHLTIRSPRKNWPQLCKASRDSVTNRMVYDYARWSCEDLPIPFLPDISKRVSSKSVEALSMAGSFSFM
jgi:hypothetical protein